MADEFGGGANARNVVDLARWSIPPQHIVLNLQRISAQALTKGESKANTALGVEMDEPSQYMLDREPMRWICCRCRAVNRALRITCRQCEKQRWEQLGFTRKETIEMSQKIYSWRQVPEYKVPA